MRKEFALVCALGLTGCAAVPTGPQNRDEWQALHTHVIQGVTERQVLDASEKVLKLADHDFTFDYPQHQLLGDRNWMVYVVLAASTGSDHWRITTQEVPEGVSTTVEISRQMNVIGPSPTFGVAGPGAGGVGVGAGSTPLPGTSVPTEFPYKLFWERLNYMLGKSPSWTTCKQAEAVPRKERMYSDVLCSMTTDDKSPI